MNLSTQAPTRTSNTLMPVFFDAPAACWWARTIVLSRNTSSKSASSHNVANSVCQPPLSDQRAKRLNTLFHGPNSAGRSRHGAPVLAIQSTASINKRLSAPVRPRSPALPWRSGSIRRHWSLRRRSLGILSQTQKTECEHIYDSVNSPPPYRVICPHALVISSALNSFCSTNRACSKLVDTGDYYPTGGAAAVLTCSILEIA